jgi:hypothetical protein
MLALPSPRAALLARSFLCILGGKAFEEKISVVSLRSIDDFKGDVSPSPSRVSLRLRFGFPPSSCAALLARPGIPLPSFALDCDSPNLGDDGLFEPGPEITPPAETPPLPMLAPPNPEGLRSKDEIFPFQSRRDAFEGKISVVSLRFSVECIGSENIPCINASSFRNVLW